MANCNNTLLFCLKLFLLSCGVVSMSIMSTKFFIPLLSEATLNMLRSFSGWLKPPYLYFVINGIIICIVASSRFHNDDGLELEPEPEPETDKILRPPPGKVVVCEDVREEEKSVVVVEKVKSDYCNDDEVVLEGNCESDGEFLVRMMDSSEVKDELQFPVEEKPLVSARFGHRKPLKTILQGERKLRVSKPRRQQHDQLQHDTLDNTWRMITQGKGKPTLTRQVKMIDINEKNGREMKKLETFNERTNKNVAAVKLRKEPSLSQEELNRRAEAFINKFNEEMRLQRLRSLEQHGKLVNNER